MLRFAPDAREKRRYERVREASYNRGYCCVGNLLAHGDLSMEALRTWAGVETFVSSSVVIQYSVPPQPQL